jgi:putative protease
LANRGYTDGFLKRHHTDTYQNYEHDRSLSSIQHFVGEITGYDQNARMAEVAVKNKFAVGDSMELILPDGNYTFVLDSILGSEGASMAEAPGSGYQVRIPVPTAHVCKGLLAKNLTINNA